MKKTLLLFLTLFAFITVVQSADLTGVKIYINPGHGGYDSNDRSVWTIPVPATWTDPAGYWESKSNLVKGLALREMLQAAGATVIISRTDNTSGIRDGAQFAGGGDRDLSEIAQEANANNVDQFLSIHSNALNSTTNYLLLLYHGADNNPTVAASLPMAQKAGPILYSNQLTVWTTSAASLRGDLTFYGDNVGLGVLRPLTVPGFLSEGSFHDYAPETHRLMNSDYCKLEALRFFQYFHEYFQRDLPQTGTIAGFVKSKNEVMNVPKFIYRAGSDDQWLPINGAVVKLLDASGQNVLQTYTVDSWYNGIYAFYNLTPGNYKLAFTATNYESKTVDVTVEPAKIAYAKMQLKNVRMQTPDYPEPDQESGVMAMSQYDFSQLANTNPAWLQGATIKRALYRNDKWYILTAEPKILVINAQTNVLIKELNLTGASDVNDIAFSADDYLLACNKATIANAGASTYFKVYSWNDDDAAPALLFQTQNQTGFTGAVFGETFAVSGSRWNSKIYTTAISTSISAEVSPRIAVVALQYNEDTPAQLNYKYLVDESATSPTAWGTQPVLTLSPSGAGDHLYVDSESLLPTEYQFDWAKANGGNLVKKATFAAQGYDLGLVSRGGNFFRNAHHTYLALPVSNTGATAVGVILFDVTEGLDKAVKVSGKYPEAGLGEQAADYMVAAAKVTGYNIELLVMAQKQGVARYKTVDQVKANIYASELSVTADKKFKFTLNEDAISVFINLYKDGESIAAYDFGALTKGAHTLDNPFAATEYNGWSITARSQAISYPVKLTGSEARFQFFSLRGVAVDNNPESPFFGRVYASEGNGGAASGRTTKDGVYVLNSALQDVTNQGANAYAGGVAWSATSAASPFRLAVAPDGKVYVADWSDTPTAGIFVMNPENPNEAFRPIFGGTVDANGLATESGTAIHGSISHCWVMGTGENTKLYTFDEDLVAPGQSRDPNGDYIAGGNLFQYNIGSATAPWKIAASAVVYDDVKNGNLQKNGNSQIAPDGRGGWWISQYRATDAAATPALIHINTTVAGGTVDFNSGNTPSLVGSSYQGGMAVSADGSRVAIGTTDEVKVFDVTFGANNAPSLTLTYTIASGGSYTYGLAFDVADNLYVAVSKSLSVYALPKADNSYTTHASHGSGTGIQPVSADRISVYPNPAESDITIDAKGLTLTGYILYDINGRAVRSGDGNAAVIATANLSSGVYLLKIKTVEGTVVKRIIKK
jgi:N-acetylmuramoyl-L-alanine amidase